MAHKIHSRYMSDTKGYIRGYVSLDLVKVAKREARARKQSEPEPRSARCATRRPLPPALHASAHHGAPALFPTGVQLDRAHADRDELRLLLHRIAHVLEQTRTSREATEAAGQRRAVAGGTTGSSALRELGELGGDLELAANEDMQPLTCK
jgi:hypothetical protein